MAAVEVVLAGLAVVLDLFLPTLVLLAMAALSQVARRRGLASLGLRRPDPPSRLVGLMLAFAVAWTPSQSHRVHPAR